MGLRFCFFTVWMPSEQTAELLSSIGSLLRLIKLLIRQISVLHRGTAPIDDPLCLNNEGIDPLCVSLLLMKLFVCVAPYRVNKLHPQDPFYCWNMAKRLLELLNSQLPRSSQSAHCLLKSTQMSGIQTHKQWYTDSATTGDRQPRQIICAELLKMYFIPFLSKTV